MCFNSSENYCYILYKVSLQEEIPKNLLVLKPSLKPGPRAVANNSDYVIMFRDSAAKHIFHVPLEASSVSLDSRIRAFTWQLLRQKKKSLEFFFFIQIY